MYEQQLTIMQYLWVAKQKVFLLLVSSPMSVYNFKTKLYTISVFFWSQFIDMIIDISAAHCKFQERTDSSLLPPGPMNNHLISKVSKGTRFQT